MGTVSSEPFVIVDSNAIVNGSWYLDSAVWRILLYRSRSKMIRLVVPDLVIKEVVGRLAGNAQEFSAAAETNARRLEKLLSTNKSLFGAPDLSKCVSEYDNAIRKMLLDSSVEIAREPESILPLLIDRAIHRHKPFDSKGSGFRDAVIWEIVVNASVENVGRRVYFISNDNCYFKSDEPSELHGQLKDDLEDRGISTSTFTIFRNIESYLTQEGIADHALLNDVIDIAQDRQDSLIESVENQLRDTPLADALGNSRAATIVEIRDTSVVIKDVIGRETPFLVHLLAKSYVKIEIESVARNSGSYHVSHELSIPGTAVYEPANRELTNLEFNLQALLEALLELPGIPMTELAQLTRLGNFAQWASLAKYSQELSGNFAQWASLAKYSQEHIDKALRDLSSSEGSLAPEDDQSDNEHSSSTPDADANGSSGNDMPDGNGDDRDDFSE